MGKNDKTKKFTVLMTAREHRLLLMLANDENLSIAQWIRTMIHRANEASEKKNRGALDTAVGLP
jgi:predicted HicB family RNase H-like nuclease